MGGIGRVLSTSLGRWNRGRAACVGTQLVLGAGSIVTGSGASGSDEGLDQQHRASSSSSSSSTRAQGEEAGSAPSGVTNRSTGGVETGFDSAGIPTGAFLKELHERQHQLALRLEPGSVAILPAAGAMHVPGTQIPLPYRQEASFRYLTGIEASDIIAAIEASPTGQKATYRLFVPEKNVEREVWEGKTISAREGCDIYGADETQTLSYFPAYLARVVKQNRPVVINSKMWRGHRFSKLFAGSGGAVSVSDRRGYVKLRDELEKAVHHLRWRKSESELMLLRRSASITSQAFVKCMQKSHAYVGENDIASLFEYECKTSGAQRMPYPQVVASGNNACTIHYSQNNAIANDGDLLLMDAGCDYNGYVSDVTRTWPVNGKFTGPQREVYELVLEAHQRCIEQCVVGSTLKQIHRLSVELLSQAVSKLGIVDADARNIILQGFYRPYYPHSIGHWLGMDTHDVHHISSTQPLEPGVVMTIEPGLYLPRHMHNIPPHYRGIGIRLEDDVVVHATGPEVLSAESPLVPEHVEKLMDASVTG